MGLTVAFLVTASLTQVTKRAIYIFLGISLAQGAIGYIQYFTAIPEILVAAHLLGATVFWIASWRVRLSVVRTPQEKKPQE